MALFPDTLAPRWQGSSILNLSSSIQAHFGLAAEHPPLATPLNLQQKVVLVVLDGLGQRQLAHHLALHPSRVLQAFQQHTLTSVFPSTTMAALTTLHIGLPPSQTGWLSGRMWLDEIGQLVNLVSGRDQHTGAKVNLDFLCTLPSVYQRLHTHKVHSTVVLPAPFVDSHLSQWHLRGAEVVGYFFTPNAAPTLVQEALQKSDHVVLYYPHYDDTCHKYGPFSQQATDEWQGMEHLLGRLIDRLPAHTTLLVTADHGQKDILQQVWLDQDPALQGRFNRAISGEKVARYLHVKPGQLEKVQEVLAPWAEVVPSLQLWEEGFFGGPPLQKHFLQRTGDLTALAHAGTELAWTYQKHAPPGKGGKGDHGGLTPTELEVPLLVLQT